MPVGQSLAWKRGDLLAAGQRLVAAAAAGLLVAVLLLALRHGGPVLAPLGVALAVYIVVGAFTDAARRGGFPGVPLRVGLTRLAGLPRSAWGTAVAHAGLGLTLLGLAGTGWGVERIQAIRVGDTVDLGPYQAVVSGAETRPGPNYTEAAVRIDLRRGGVPVATVEPSRRAFSTRQATVSQAGIATLWFGQVYISLGDGHGDGTMDARLFWKPLVTFIWLGAVAMGLGGCLSLSDRGLRIGFARRAARALPLHPHPAE
jgi:cytochrome c-type biogenesis protein CcmF